MSGALRTLYLSAALRAQAEAEAEAAAPRECCGLIEGVFDQREARATALHPVRNLAVEADRFELDPAEHFALLRAARSRDHAIVGCYHSHPNGRAEPSKADAAGADEEGFLWLIIALAGGKTSVRAFVRAGDGFAPLALATGQPA